MDDIMEKLPDPFSMSEIMGKVEERTPYVVVAFQVILPYLRNCTLKRVPHTVQSRFSDIKFSNNL